MFQRFLSFAAPSAFGVSVAAIFSALAETAPNTYSVSQALAGAGFLILFALPLGLAASLAGRGLLHAWNIPTLLAPICDERGASPRFTAWALFLLLASLTLAFGTFQGMRLLFASTRINTLVALGAPVVVLVQLFVVVALSRPLVGLLEIPLAGFEARRQRRGASALLSPLRVTWSFVSMILIAAVGTWFMVILPNIGHLDVSFVVYIALFAVGVMALPVLYARVQWTLRVRRALAGGVTAALLVCCGASMWTRYNKPYQMLEIWGETKLAGWAIDSIYDVQSLRVDLRIEGIEPKALPDAAHPNVVIITIDTVRADQTPIYGGPAKMPVLEELSKRGAVFERAFAPGNVTRRSLPTLATGLSPRRVRGRVVGWALRMDPRHIMLAERFQAGGYDTAGFFCCRSHFGRDHRLGLIRGLEHVAVEYEGDLLAKQTVEWLKARTSDQPLMLWTHYIEPHNWMKDHKPKDGARRKKERYNLSLEATDAFLKELVATIYEELGEDTIIVVTADHGEGLGDHGVKTHAGSLYNTEIRVPLVVTGPDIVPSRFQQVVGLVDIAPTLLELAGFEPPGMPQMDGLSLAPVLRRSEKDKLGVGEAYAMMVSDRSVQQNQSAIISGRYKLIEREGSKYELFDLSRDPKEKKDIKDDAPELLLSMKARLKRRKEIDRVSPF